LAINTLSTLMQLPVNNHFGITGAPWTKGVKKNEIGGSVIIGGHKRKAEKVLQHLRLMYMPLQNYKDLELELLGSYWAQKKDILGVTHFGDLVPEVLWLGAAYENQTDELISLRIDYKINKYKGFQSDPKAKNKIIDTKRLLREQMEKEIRTRLKSIHLYLRNPTSDPHISLSEIFKMGRQKKERVMAPMKSFITKVSQLRDKKTDNHY
jgi:hypothetical protein